MVTPAARSGTAPSQCRHDPGIRFVRTVLAPTARAARARQEIPMFDRLFGNRPSDPAVADRVPPGQYLTEKFPVLHYGSVPKTDLSTWDFKVYGEVDAPVTLTW